MTNKLDSIQISNICCIGAGYVGGPTMAVIADKCKDIRVTVVDINKKRINSWNDENLDKIPVFEPGLKEIVGRARNKNLFFTDNMEDSIKNADIIFISVNTPIKQSGLGAGFASDMKWVEKCARQIGEMAIGHTIVVEKSTLPVRTAKIIKEILSSTSSNKFNSKPKTFSILSNPEFLAEGTAINDLINPDRVLIGGEDEKAIEVLSNIYRNWVPNQKILTTNLWSSELSKLVANAFLAQRVSSINSISALCEATGANVKEVSNAVGLDNRIGNKFLNSGPGFGGSCFKKDILNLVYLCRFFNLEEVADFWYQIVLINDWQQKRIYEVIVRKLFGNINGKIITILGFSFKSNTNDTRESPAIKIANYLLVEGANLRIHDPKVSYEQISIDLQEFKEYKSDESVASWQYCSRIPDAVKDSDGIVLATEWEEYTKLDWEKISRLMKNPGWVFDTRQILNGKEIKNNGLNYWGLGEGDEKKEK